MTVLTKVRCLHIVSAAVALGALVVPAVVQAAPIQLAGSYPQRAAADGTPSVRQPRADDDYAGNGGVNRADCESEETWAWSFALPTTGFSSLQVWTSPDNLSCADPQHRTGGASPRCFRAATFDYATVANAGVAKLRSRDLIKAGYRALDVSDPKLLTSEAICRPTVDMQPTRVFLHFMLFDSAGNVVGSTTDNEYESVYQTTYDLRGPDAPTAPSATGGALKVDLAWTPGGATDKDFVGHRIYCFPRAASSGDAGACPAGAAGVLPTAADEKHLCGNGGPTGGTIQGLDVNQPYEIRVAAYDRYGNAGPYAPSVCASMSGPVDAVDQPGGSSGGGGCALGAPARGGALGALGVLGALGLLARRRSRAR